MEWLLVEGKFETEARILGMRLAKQGCYRPLLQYQEVFSRFILHTIFLELAK